TGPASTLTVISAMTVPDLTVFTVPLSWFRALSSMFVCPLMCLDRLSPPDLYPADDAGTGPGGDQILVRPAWPHGGDAGVAAGLPLLSRPLTPPLPASPPPRALCPPPPCCA